MRDVYGHELEQLHLQVEVMGVLVDQNLERMRAVLQFGDQEAAAVAVRSDDEIDAMNVSLTERCYDLLCREAPVASDLRLVTSVLKVIGELERIGDLALRVVKLVDGQPKLAGEARVFDLLLSMADEAVERYRDAMRAWASHDLELATTLATGSRHLDLLNRQLAQALVALDGPDAVGLAIEASTIGRALDRIADHAALLGVRIRYLITGDTDHLAAEV